MTCLWRCYHKLMKGQLSTTADKREIKDSPKFAYGKLRLSTGYTQFRPIEDEAKRTSNDGTIS